MSRIRRSTEEGHRRKFLVVIDDTTECERALYFAARRAEHTAGGLVLLNILPPADFQHWMGVEQIMREEATEEARAVLERAADKIREFTHVEPECVIREGRPADEILALIDEDEDIAILVLAAATGSEGPGPLVSIFTTRRAAALSVPVTVVPGSLSHEELDALT
ncbi:MAG: universal stress protein [Rhodobiaceae bacterium]|nr:universal stress protein [Rhodobiaceae bacterium]